MLTITPCLLWLTLSLMVLFPGRLTKEEWLFLFLASSIIIMLLFSIPAASLQSPDMKFGMSEETVFLLNRNLLFPLLTVLFIGWITRRNWPVQILFLTVFSLVTGSYIRLDERLTIVTHVPYIFAFTAFYLCTMLLLHQLFRWSAKNQMETVKDP
ncbi:hypothetical protein [Sporolactobacillus vineae]|uniref:hypothetical protein n=1 Tax=Sporolactobacillus vineae TaxID=444463 RepID=UPI00028925F8|nr:hypothetical protein [Sporolactobacillus vineae]